MNEWNSRKRLLLAALLVAGLLHPGRLRAQAAGGINLPAPLKDFPVASAPAPPPAPVAQSPLAIPLPQVADRAEDLDRKLESIARDLSLKQDEIAPDLVLGAQAAEIRERARHVDNLLADLPDILHLRDEIVYWRALNYQSSEHRKLLTTRAAELQAQLRMLDDERAKWQATRDGIHDVSGIEVVATRVQQELDAIQGIRLRAQDQLNQVLTLQNELSQTGRQIADSLTKLTDAEDSFRGHLLNRDGEPLWQLRSLRDGHQTMTALLRRTGHEDRLTVEEFLRTGAFALFLIPVVYFLSLLGAIRLKHYLASATRAGVPPRAVDLLSRPHSLALFAALLVSLPLTSSAPLSVSLVFYLFWLGLVFHLTPSLVESGLQPFLYLLLAFNLVEVLRVGLPLWPGLNRLILTVILGGALLCFGWLGRASRLRRLHLPRRQFLLLQSGIRLSLALWAIAIVAGIFGFVSLSHVLGVGTLLSAFFAVSLYCVYRLALLLLIVYLDSRWAASFSPELRAGIHLWGRRILAVAALILWWTRSELYIFMVQDSFTGVLSSVLAFSIDLGKVHFTVGSVLTVLLILVIGYGLSKGLTSLLQSLLAAKFPFQRGVPYAISKVTYYCLMLLVFTAAIASAGVELNKFTVITGALGVGVGFGLQNIVNNFASGLILLFERPIRVGDTVEVNGLVGAVKRIGARSSTISTGQGSEVIVPNSNLLSNQVVNWTLSSPRRRVEINVGVAYGTDPQAVLKLLTAVAAANPNVMTEPPPAAYFLGFGDSALNFELRFWSARQETWFQLKSDVTIGVARALQKANIDIPFPQQDLHLKSMDFSLAGQAILDTENGRAPQTSPASGAIDPASAPENLALEEPVESRRLF